MTAPDVAALQQQCDEFNAQFRPGQRVMLRKDDGSSVATATRSKAEVLSGHSAVVWLEGVTGCYLLDRVLPLTMTPGFEKQAADLCAYVVNTGQVPLRVDDFDDDWSPAGDNYRTELRDAGLIEEREPAEDGATGGIVLTGAGRALAETSRLLARQPVPQP